ncbi:MAG: choice-of-anchor B family protein, partial [Rhodothermales bacterium]|nr:choice-of-anchor B family protein [Rhodothermales bacterium]
PSSLQPGYEFGGAYARAGFRTQAMAFAAGHMAVSAFNAETNSGAVHFYAPSGEETTILRGTEGEGFGYALVGDFGDPIFIGVPGADNERGAVDVYVLRDGMLVPDGRLAPDDLEPRSGLGRTLAWSDGVLYAGASGMNTVLRFVQNDAGQWEEMERLIAPEARSLGTGVAVHGDRILAGDRGSAWLFDGDQITHLEAPSGRAQRGFGVGLAVAAEAVAVASPSADYEEGIVSVFEPTENGWEATGTLAPDVSFLASIRGTQVDCEEGKAALFECDNVDMLSLLSAEEMTSERGVKMTDIWGWEDPETGHEWVLIGRTDGTAFVNIADPTNPIYVGELLRTEGSPGAAWRDVKVYKNHAFVVADGSGQHGVQIFDLTQLRDVEAADMPVTFEETAHYDGTASTHNIVINEDTGFAYAVGNRAGGETCNGQSHMIDIRDPANPTFAGCFSEAQSGGTHDAQCVLYHGPDADYSGSEICLSSNGSSLVISDVTDKDNPSTVALATYPLTHYTHQGWLDESHSYFYMNDELDEMNGAVDRTRTLIWDVQDLDDPQLVNQFYLDSAASDHNLYIDGQYMYQSNYQAGLRILDISDPVNPVEVGHFDTAPYAEDAAGFGGSWSNYPYFRSGVIAVSSRAEGLFLVRFRKVDS